MISLTRRSASIAGVVALLLLPATAVLAAPTGDDDPRGGDIRVTIVDPTPSATPQPSTPPSGSGTGVSQPGRGGGGGGTVTQPDADAEPEPSVEGSGSGWIVVSGLENSAHGEVNPFGGWVRSSVTVVNRSETATVDGTLVFRMRTLFGAPIGPAVTRELTGIEPGKAHTSSVRLLGIGQWPLVQVSVTFEPGDTADADPIAREAWVIAFPWLALVVLVLLVATGVILWLRRNSIRSALHSRGGE